MKKFLAGIWLWIKQLFVSTWWVWLSAWIACIIGLVFGWHIAPWVFFGGVIAMILYVFGRQIWWFISGTGDSQGRNGLLKRLWNKIFKK
jgi:hypothetical protein